MRKTDISNINLSCNLFFIFFIFFIFYLNILKQNNVTQKLDLIFVKSTFFQVYKKIILLQFFKNLFQNIVLALISIFIINKNTIQIDKDKNVKFF